ncbi:hypothetical protein D5W64_12745 [Salmonella enterica subsp. enterica serovar Saintpaul]|nr:hypothetical protein [Salmonella enterica subsp. enterica serovar Saintpaul]
MDKKTFEFDGRIYINGGDIKVSFNENNEIVYDQKTLDEAVLNLPDPGEIKVVKPECLKMPKEFCYYHQHPGAKDKAENLEVKGVCLKGQKSNSEREGGLRRDQMQLDYAFNSRYGSMGSGNTLYRELTKSLFDNLVKADQDSWIITEATCKAAVKEIFDIELENGYDKIPKAVVIGAMRPYVWLDDRTAAIPEDGYSVMEFVEFLKGMLDVDQLREMDPVERKAMLNYRSGSYGAWGEAKYLYPNSLTSECRVQGKKILIDPKLMELYPEENIKGVEASRVAIIGGGRPIGLDVMKRHLTNVAVGVLSDMHISYPFADVAEIEEDRPQTVKGNGRQVIIDNGNGKSWPAAKTRKGHRRV